MSRIRSLHPGLWTDEAFMRLSAYARLLYIGLWSEAFDDGVFEWKPLTLKARIFPVDNVDIEELLAEIVSAGCIREGDTTGKRYGLIRNFRLFQRPKKPNSSGLLRAADEQYVGVVRNQSGTGGEKSPQMEDEGGSKEEVEKEPPAPVSASEGARADFLDLWESFPENPTSSQPKAKAAFDKLKPDEQLQAIEAAKAYSAWFAADCEARGRTIDAGLRFVPHLATWLGGDWRKPVARASPTVPVIPMVRLDRERDASLWKACEKVQGKRAPTDGMEWSFPAEVVEKARATA